LLFTAGGLTAALSMTLQHCGPPSSAPCSRQAYRKQTRHKRKSKCRLPGTRTSPASAIAGPATLAPVGAAWPAPSRVPIEGRFVAASAPPWARTTVRSFRTAAASLRIASLPSATFKIARLAAEPAHDSKRGGERLRCRPLTPQPQTWRPQKLPMRLALGPREGHSRSLQRQNQPHGRPDPVQRR